MWAAAVVVSDRGVELFQQGKLEEAIAAWREAIRLRPAHALAHNNLGAALVKQGKWAEAIPELREAIRLQPDLALAHDNLGAAPQGQGKLAEAIAASREAIRLQPDLALAHANLGAALVKQGKWAEAIPELREAIRLQPDLAMAHNNRAALVQEQLEGVFREIPSPGPGVQVRYSATHKGSQALVAAAYDLSWSLEQLQEHYGRLLETKGWRFTGVQVVRDWGREIGLRQATWSRPPFRAALFYCRAQKVAYGCDYSFSLSWGLH
jgi:tetratricopeptide (TPR) repeat protein